MAPGEALGMLDVCAKLLRLCWRFRAIEKRHIRYAMSSLIATADPFSHAGPHGRTRQEPSATLLAPVVLLAGHQSEVLNCQFSLNGTHLATCGGDGAYIWNVLGHEIQGHKLMDTPLGKEHAAALDIMYLTNESLVSSGPGGNLHIWDTATGRLAKTCHSSPAAGGEGESETGIGEIHYARTIGPRAARWKKPAAHHAAIHCLQRLGENVFISGSSDHSFRVWDTRYKCQVWTVRHACPVTALSASHASSLVYSSGTTPDLCTWDLRKFSLTATAGMARREHAHEPVSVLPSVHSDTISCLKLDPSSGTRLSSWSMDGHVNTYSIVGAAALVSRWKGPAYGHHDPTSLLRHDIHPASGTCLAVPSADRSIHLFDSLTGQSLSQVSALTSSLPSALSPGHRGTVNAVAWHPTLPLLASVGADRQAFLMELSPAATKCQ